MSGIRSKNTRQEVTLRKLLHRKGFRYRLYTTTVPGRPDMVFPAYRAAVFVHGCFWHGHDCRLFKLPGTRTEFWRDKIGRNSRRDLEVRHLLEAQGWRHMVVWECAARGGGDDAMEKVADSVAGWLRSPRRHAEIRGA